MSFQIVTFYKFKNLAANGALDELRDSLKTAMREHSIFGTIILAEEGFNATICGAPENLEKFIRRAETVFQTEIIYKSSFHEKIPFRRVHVKIKPEIVTLKRAVDFEKGIGTHVAPREWNEIIERDDVFVLDARNDYEFQVGTFRGAVNPQTAKFSDLPQFIDENMNPATHQKVAMFCTGGIRCEKFAPYLKELGFAEVFQLQGGILQYLEEIPPAESRWEGECFVFDERVTVDENLEKGNAPDLSVKNK